MNISNQTLNTESRVKPLSTKPVSKRKSDTRSGVILASVAKAPKAKKAAKPSYDFVGIAG